MAGVQASGTFAIGGDLTVHRLGFGAMRITGSGIWGASSKGVIYSLFLQRAGVTVDQVVDINPAKQGRYLPLSGMRVSSPQEAMEALPAQANLFVMNSNYLEEIKRMTDGRYVYHAVDSASFR